MSGKTTTARLSAAIAQLIRPLVRLMLQHGVTYPHFIRLVRRVYVEVAEKEFRLPDQKQTDSRITLLTGIHRRYVKELRKAPADEGAIPVNVSLGGQLVANWLSDERFVDAEGHPLALSRFPTEDAPNFEHLVLSVTTDLRPRAILDELLRLKVVRIEDEDMIVLERGAFVPDAGTDENLFFFGRNLHDHIAASAHNIDGNTPTFMDRSAYNSQLTETSARELASYAEEQGMQALRAVHQRANTLRSQDEECPDAVYRVNFGTYFYSVSEEEGKEGASEGSGHEK
ncbi:MAG: hypothetical protein JRC77_08730 [Deltaproteobacteria bacterium]|nr:hypothetical protein [Deltaproteobacteria bacterium]